LTCNRYRDVKRGQKLEAEARSSRPGAQGQGRGQQLEAEVEARCKNSQLYMSAVIISHHIETLDGKYSESVQLPAKAKFGGFCLQHLATLATPTILPAKAKKYVFTGVGLCVCLCVYLSVTTITKKVADGFVPNFMGRFPGRKERPSWCFVTIGRGMWK